MAQNEELNTAMGDQKKALERYLTEAEGYLAEIAGKVEGEAKVGLDKAHSAVTAARDHLAAYANTVLVVAESRSGLARGVAAPLGAGPAVGLSGVPVTPPGAPGAESGPAVPHVDVGQRDGVTGATYAAPAAVNPEAQPVHPADADEAVVRVPAHEIDERDGKREGDAARD